MGLRDLFKKEEKLIAVDLGSTSIKLVELDLSGKRPKLLNIGVGGLSGEVFANNVVSNVTKVSETISSLIEANGIADRRVVTAVPGPAVFAKRIKAPKLEGAELQGHIQFEAANFIPHNVNAVKLDYHVIGASGKNQLDVLVVAVKNEIVDSFLESFGMAGLEVAVVDVDHFALQNMFELCYPDYLEKTVALVNVGARYSSINICSNGASLFTGDIPVGGRLFTEAIAEGTGLSFDEAERLKRNVDKSSPHFAARQEALDKNVEYVAAEFNRQLTFFWNASGSEDGIDCIMLAGGGMRIPGLLEELAEKTGLPCEPLDPLRGIEAGENLDPAYLEDIGPLMSIAIGMGIRQTGDKIETDFN